MASLKVNKWAAFRLTPIVGSANAHQPIFSPVLVSLTTPPRPASAAIGVGTGKSLSNSSAHLDFLLLIVS
jgi:hypothetical protein